MRKLIKDQLKACVFADLHNVEEIADGYIVHIPKYTKPKYDIGKIYLVELPDLFVNNTTADFSLENNNGTAPKTKYLKIYVARQSGKLIYVDSQGYDYDNYKDLSVFWSGWLPSEALTLISKL